MATACTALTRFVLLSGSCSSTWRAKIFALTTSTSSWCAAVLHSQEVSLIKPQTDKETDDDLLPRSCRYTQYSNISNGSPHRVHPIASLLPLLPVPQFWNRTRGTYVSPRLVTIPRARWSFHPLQPPCNRLVFVPYGVVSGRLLTCCKCM